MRKVIASFICIFTSHVYAGEWLTLEPHMLSQVEVAQAGAVSFAAEGVYIKNKTSFITSQTCTNKEFVVFTDSKLADRVYSAVLYAASTNKTLRFYVEGCSNSYIQGKMFMIVF